MKCQNCLTALPQGVSFCTYCGSSQITDPRVASGQITQMPFPPASASFEEAAQVQAQNARFSLTGKVPTPVHTEPADSVLQAESKEQKEDTEREKENENERLLVFSDAIIAFALTVAAITIKIPTSAEQLQANSFSIILRCFMYIVAFVIVAGAWADHHSIFHQIKRNDIVLVTLNFFYLAAIVLFPIGLFFLEFGLELANVNEVTTGASQTLLGLGIFMGSQIIAGLALVRRNSAAVAPSTTR